MPGNSARKGARRSTGSKKGATVGSGGQRRRALQGRGPTPPADQRPGHSASRRNRAAATPRTKDSSNTGGTGTPTRSVAGSASQPSGAPKPKPRGGTGSGSSRGKSSPRTKLAAKGGGRESSGRGTAAPRGTTSRARRPPAAGTASELVAGRNAVLEALRAQVPASTLYVGERLDSDDRVREAIRLATDRGVALLEVSRHELDRMTSDAVHQGLALQVPPYRYAHPDDLLLGIEDAGANALLVALDGVTDPRNLGAVVRSAAAFGAHGVVIPERRAAGMTAGAWKASAGAAARLPIARATNLVRQLELYKSKGLAVVGLAADGTVDATDLEAAVDPLVLVVGSEGRGLSRLVARTCDFQVRIPMLSGNESLNAGVATGIALYEIARRRSDEHR